MNSTSDEEDQFDPRAYMKARRPYLFSDAKEKEQAEVDKGLLEYSLETLTSRQEEIRFEQFALHLAKKEICPNLIPHTGPTGGGDGKTDSENYQVSEEIAALWYIGDPKRASTEKFALCFSAKKDWKPKFKSDIASVLSTGRNFSVIYFITNQFASSKERADLQDRYGQETGKEIKILDRQWIVDRVINHKHWNLVSQHLGIGESRSATVDGPQNIQNKAALDQLEQDLAEADSQGLPFAEDCLEAALLARNIGLPSYEVFGRFERAERASEKNGSQLQLFRIIYKRAWTAYWWYNDFPELSRLYDKAESLVMNNDSSFILQDLSSLCQVGITASSIPKFAHLAPLFADRSARLKASFERVAKAFPDTANGLWAETYVCTLELFLNPDANSVTKFCESIKTIVPRGKRHAGYPVEAIYRIVCEEFSKVITDNEAFDELFELIMDIQSKRVSESTKGSTRLNRGLQLYEKGKNYQAIDHLTKAQILLAKDEHANAYCLATFAAGVAYRDAGLFWAARANMAVAVSLFLQSKLRSGDIVPAKIMHFLQEYADTELLLGRPFCALQVIELSLMLAGKMNLSDGQRERFQFLDARLTRMILATSAGDLARLEKLPDVLHTYLQFSASAFLFCLGHEEKAQEWIEEPKIEELLKEIAPKTPQEIEDHCTADWYLDEPFLLKSKILGCELELKAHDRFGVLIGESVLAFVENFLATAVMLNNCIAMRSSVNIELKFDKETTFTLAEKEDDCGVKTLLIKYAFDAINDFADPETYSKKLFDSTVEILKLMHLSFDEQSLEELFAKHEVLNRCEFAASSLTSVLKLFGNGAKYTYDDWVEDKADAQTYSLLRPERWLRFCAEDDSEELMEEPESSANAPLLDIESFSQRDFHFQSPIDIRIWQRAKWSGTAFGVEPDSLSAIDFWLTFEDLGVAKQIFRGWRKRVGSVDEKEWLGVSIITGIDAQHPSHYRVVLSISENHIKALRGRKGLITLSPAILTMGPTTPLNLDRFLKAYEVAGWYDLGPAVIVNNQLQCATDLSIRKKELTVIPAWQIDEKNPLLMALSHIENPVVPEDIDIQDAPIWFALKKLRSLPSRIGDY
jgi:hypothetical protein